MYEYLLIGFLIVCILLLIYFFHPSAALCPYEGIWAAKEDPDFAFIAIKCKNNLYYITLMPFRIQISGVPLNTDGSLPINNNSKYLLVNGELKIIEGGKETQTLFKKSSSFIQIPSGSETPSPWSGNWIIDAQGMLTPPGEFTNIQLKNGIYYFTLMPNEFVYGMAVPQNDGSLKIGNDVFKLENGRIKIGDNGMYMKRT